MCDDTEHLEKRRHSTRLLSRQYYYIEGKQTTEDDGSYLWFNWIVELVADLQTTASVGVQSNWPKG